MLTRGAGMMEATSTAALLNIALPFLLALSAFIIILSRSLLTAAILQGIFSLLMAALYLVLDARRGDYRGRGGRGFEYRAVHRGLDSVRQRHPSA